MRGKIYGVGVGPGDPELMTLKAVRLIRESDVIAFPGKSAEESVAYQIARGAVPEIAEKTLVPVYMPMIRDRETIADRHRAGAGLLEKYLDRGQNVVYLTLGDSTVYCTFSYLQHIMEEDGYEVELVSGITSFCAAAARLGISLTEWNEPLHVIPASHRTGEPLDLPGTYVLMKSASHMRDTKELLIASGREVSCVENCGMENEKIYRSAQEIPDDAGYFSLVIAKENNIREKT